MTIVCAIAWRQALPEFISGGFVTYAHLFLPAGFLLFGAVAFSLAALFTTTRWLRYGVLFAGAVVPYFFLRATIPVLGGLAVSVLLITVALHAIRRERDLLVGFSVSGILKVGLPLYFTIAALTSAFFYFASVKGDVLFEIVIPHTVRTMLFRQLAGPLESLTGLSHLDPEDTVDAALTKFLEAELAKEGKSFASLAPAERDALLQNQREAMTAQFGIALDGAEPIGNVISQNIVDKGAAILGPYKKYFPIASAFAFFLALKALTWPLYYFTLGIVFLLIKLLIAVKFIKERKEEITIERLTL